MTWASIAAASVATHAAVLVVSIVLGPPPRLSVVDGETRFNAVAFDPYAAYADDRETDRPWVPWDVQRRVNAKTIIVSAGSPVSSGLRFHGAWRMQDRYHVRSEVSRLRECVDPNGSPVWFKLEVDAEGAVTVLSRSAFHQCFATVSDRWRLRARNVLLSLTVDPASDPVGDELRELFRTQRQE